MTQQPELDPAGQKEHLDEIALSLVEALPPDWRELVILFDRLGRAAGFGARLTRPDGAHESWRPPDEILRSLDRLRAGMHVDGEGTWFSCRFALVPAGRWDIQYS